MTFLSSVCIFAAPLLLSAAGCTSGICDNPSLKDEISLLQVKHALKVGRPTRPGISMRTKDDPKSKVALAQEFQSANTTGPLCTRDKTSALEKYRCNFGKFGDSHYILAFAELERKDKMTLLKIDWVDSESSCTDLVTSAVQLIEMELKVRFDYVMLYFDAEPANMGCSCYQHAMWNLGFRTQQVAYGPLKARRIPNKPWDVKWPLNPKGQPQPPQFGYGFLINCRLIPPKVKASSMGKDVSMATDWLWNDRLKKDRITIKKTIAKIQFEAGGKPLHDPPAVDKVTKEVENKKMDQKSVPAYKKLWKKLFG